MAFLYWSLTFAFEYGDEEVLRERIHDLRSLLRRKETTHAELNSEIESEWDTSETPRIYLRILDARYNTFLEAPGMTLTLPIEVFPRAGDPPTPSRGVRVRLPSGRLFRVMTGAAAGARPSDHWIIQAAVDIQEEEALLNKYRHLLVIVLLAAALISLGFAHRITRTAMRPLAEIVEKTRRIQSSTLSERIHLPHLPAELESLADNFNSMLERLDESFARLSRFSADIAHELRTPVNILRGEAEVALRKPRSVAEYRDVLVSSLEEYSQLSRIIDTLLFIAQAETPETEICRETVDVAAEFTKILDFYEPVASEKLVTLAVRVDGDLRTDVDRVLFRRAVGNLVANAVAHTPDGGTVVLSAVQNDSATRVEVADTGIGIAAEHLPQVFDRFYRAERARVRDSGSVGLGLSIVKVIMDLHQGSVGIASEPGTGTRVSLIFPRHSADCQNVIIG
jgi:two-component system, OmpR family, heavy metal sensor histidine kinase CusS